MEDSQLFSQQIWQACEQQYASNPTAYIELQDHYQVNVNLFLLAQELDKSPQRLTVEQWQLLQESIIHWEQTVLVPYRQLRRLAKAHLDTDEYQKMLDVELMMERKSQRIILQQLNSMKVNCFSDTDSDSNNSNNSNNYLSLYGIDSSYFKP
ncbi:DUF2390 domain-containing protein [Shewanella gaetbuli]